MKFPSIGSKHLMGRKVILEKEQFSTAISHGMPLLFFTLLLYTLEIFCQ